MPKLSLTDKLIKGLRAEPGTRLDVADLLRPGLHLRISPPSKKFPDGCKSWCLMYRVKGDERQQRRTYGPYPRVSLAEARELARMDLNEAALGIDPAVRKTEEVLTFRALWKEYLERYVMPNVITWKQDVRRANKDLLPYLGDLPAKDIKKAHVLRVVDRVAARGLISANQSVRLLNRIFRWAVSRDLLESNPAYLVRMPGRVKPGERFLSGPEIAAAFELLEKHWRGETAVWSVSPVPSRIILGRMLLGSRTKELLLQRFDQIERENGVPKWWNVPGSVTKNKRPNRVPLMPLYRELILEPLGGNDPEGYVFKSVGGKPWADGSVDHYTVDLCKILGFKFTPRDLRRTFLTHAARLGVPEEIRQRWVNHSRGTIESRHYNLYDYDTELQEAAAVMDRFFRGLFYPDTAAHVIPFVRQ